MLSSRTRTEAGGHPFAGMRDVGSPFYITGISASSGNKKHMLSLDPTETTSPQLLTHLWLVWAASALAGSIQVPLVCMG